MRQTRTEDFRYDRLNRLTQSTYTDDTTTLSFSYGADRARFKQVNNATNLTTFYLGGLYEKQINTLTNVTTHVHYIKAGGSTIAIYKAKDDPRCYKYKG